MSESLADRLLKGHERTLTLTFRGAEYPTWVLMEHLLWIVDKDGSNIPFRLNYQQCRLYLEMCRQREAGTPIRADILKARQIGFTTFIAGLFFITAMFTPNAKVGIIADSLDHAKGIFDKMQHFYDCLDLSNPARAQIEAARERYGEKSEQYAQALRSSNKPKLKWNRNQTSMATEHGNSVIEVMAVGDTAGSSKTYQMVHCSELALWPDIKGTLGALLHSVSRNNANSMVFLETTARGFNEYKRRWDLDFSGHSPFSAFFVPWFDNPEYRSPVPDGIDLGRELEAWELDKQRAHSLSDEQMWFWHQAYLEQDRDRALTMQEMPFTPVDAFASSGASVFDRDLLAIRKEEVIAEMAKNPPKEMLFTYSRESSRDMGAIDIRDRVLRESRGGPILIFEGPDPTHPYVVTCDPNMGGSDDVAMQVVDNYTGRQVARFRSNDMPLDECAWQLYCLGMHYNRALVSSETNVGQIVMDLLIKAHYPKLYVEQAEEYANYRRSLKACYGHKTTKANRQFMIDSLKLAFRQDPLMVRDYDTLCEMETFQLVERYDRDGNVTSSKQEAAGKGNHDDLVMALAAFYKVRSQQSAVPTESHSIDGGGLSIEELESMLEKRRREAAKAPNRAERIIGIRW